MTDELLPYDEVMANYEPVVGLEVHVELSTATKMFCGCSTDTDKDPNTNVCPVCLGLPGSMPAINGHAVESAIRIGLALNCHIAQWCRMARKNYFYPDMTKNYQTSQYDEPICYDGWLDVEPAVIANRFVVLGGLIILRHVRVEVVLPGHAAPLGNVTVESQTNPNGRFDGMTVDGRHGSGQTQANRANIGIGILVSIG